MELQEKSQEVVLGFFPVLCAKWPQMVQTLLNKNNIDGLLLQEIRNVKLMSLEHWRSQELERSRMDLHLWNKVV